MAREWDISSTSDTPVFEIHAMHGESSLSLISTLASLMQ